MKFSLFRFVAIALIYFSLARLGLMAQNVFHIVAPLWAASGFALAALAFCGFSYWPAILVGSTLANLVSPLPMSLQFALVVANTVEALVGGWLYRRARQTDMPAALQTDFTLYTGLAVLAPILSATLGITALAAHGQIKWSDWGEGALTWWTGNALGILLFMPWLLTMKTISRHDWKHLTIVLTLVAAALATVLRPQFGAPYLGAIFFAIFFASLILLPNSFAFRTTTLVLALGLIVGANFPRGPFAGIPVSQAILSMQLVLVALCMVSLALESLQRMGFSRTSIAVVFLGLLLSSALYRSYHLEEIQQDEERFVRSTQIIQSQFTNRMQLFEDVMRGAAGLFVAQPNLTAREWNHFLKPQMLMSRYPGFRGIGIIQKVDKSTLPAFVQRHRAQESRPFLLQSYAGEATGPYRYIISHFEPLDGNQYVLGFDLTSDPIRRAAADLAMVKGEAVATDTIQLVRIGQPGLLLLFPVYQSGQIPKTTSERERQLRGWIFTAFVFSELFGETLISPSNQLNITVYDGEHPSESNRLFTSSLGGPAPERFTSLTLYNHRLTLGWSRSEAFFSERPRLSPIVMWVGSLLTALLALLIASLQTTRDRAYNLAQTMTKQLREIRDQFEVAVAGSNDGLWDWNISTNAVYFSPRWKEMLGYQDHEIANHFSSWNELTHPDDQERAKSLVKDYLDGKESTFAIEMRLRHKMGHYVWILARGAALRDTNGQPYRMAGSHTDISKHKAIESELILARKEAEASARAKSEFLAIMSHEVRTPINGILGTLNLLQKTKLSADQLDYLTAISHSAENLLSVLTDVLDYSKIEAGRMDLEFIDFDLAQIVRNVQQTVGASALQKGLALDILMPRPAIPWLRGDPSRLRQIIINFLSNAIKFTRRGGITVQFSVVAHSENHLTLRCEVEDTGVGIPKEALEKIFEPFSQADSSTTRQFGGTGLGLSICKRLIDLMDGRMGVESTVGVGSVFWFEVRFQLGQQPLRTAIDPFADDPVIRITQGARVLIAEDNPVNRRVTVSLMSNLGYQTKGVENGLQVLKELEENSYDVVLLDCHMPELDGFATAQQIRSHQTPSLRQIPLLALTAGAIKGDRERCLSAGMDDYMSKPVKAEAIAQRIEKWLAARLPSETLDQRALEAIGLPERGGSPELLTTVIQLYFDNAQSQLRQIADAIRAGNFDDARKLAHSLKSSSATVGLRRMSEICRRIEDWTLKNSPLSMQEWLSLLERELPDAMAALAIEARWAPPDDRNLSI